MTLYDRMKSQKKDQADTGEDIKHLLQQIRSKLLNDLGSTNTETPDILEREIILHLEAILGEEKRFLPKAEKEELVHLIMQDMIGLGPIQPLIDDEEVTEIMVNGPRQIYFERKGKLELSEYTFLSDEHVLNTIEKIIYPLGRRIDESSPMVDARLLDGSRVNAIIPPIALNGPTLTIRKFRNDSLTIKKLIQLGSLDREMARYLEKKVKERNNIIVAGGTGSGKTTLLNILSGFIPDNERIITIEDAAELKLRQSHVVSMESRPPNIENKGEVTIRDLIRNSLRMRPDRIIVGEVRGGEALDMLQAMNTGHDGSLSTIHANSPRDVLSRLETLVLMAGYDLPIRAIREQIASAINVIIQQRRLSDGSRKITHITEICGMENGTITLQDVFVFEEIQSIQFSRVRGSFKRVGIESTLTQHD